MRLGLVLLALALVGCAGHSSQGEWWFSCRNPPPTTASGPPGAPVTTFPTAPALDEATIRREHPDVAAALDACAATGRAELKGPAVFEADRDWGERREAMWGDAYVSATRIA